MASHIEITYRVLLVDKFGDISELLTFDREDEARQFVEHTGLLPHTAGLMTVEGMKQHPRNGTQFRRTGIVVAGKGVNAEMLKYYQHKDEIWYYSGDEPGYGDMWRGHRPE